MRCPLILVVVLGVAGCEEPSPGGDYPPLLDQAGDPCRSLRSLCLDEHSARECVDGVWVDRSCEQSCAERGPAMLSEGCVETDVDGWLIEGCACVPEPGACAPGATACESESEIGHCDDAQVWTTYDCAEVCAQSLATPVSTGCALGEDGLAACWCVAD